jgi:hypothetical protein
MRTVISLLWIFLWVISPGLAQRIDLSVQQKNKELRQLDIVLRPQEEVINGDYSGGVFTLRVPVSSGQELDVDPVTSPYGFSFAGPVFRHEGYDYYRFQFAGFVHRVNWRKDAEYPVLTLGYSGTGPMAAELISGNSWTSLNNADYYQELGGQAAQGKFYRRYPKLLSFDAQLQGGKTIALQWALAPTDMLRGLWVEYSPDGQQYISLYEEETRPEAPDFPAFHTYYHYQSGMFNFFRIRMEDDAGQLSYSETRAVIVGDAARQCAIYPNPAFESLHVDVQEGKTFSCQWMNSRGEVLSRMQWSGANTVLEVSSYPAGAYYLLIYADGKPYCGQLILVQR